MSTTKVKRFKLQKDLTRPSNKRLVPLTQMFAVVAKTEELANNQLVDTLWGGKPTKNGKKRNRGEGSNGQNEKKEALQAENNEEEITRLELKIREEITEVLYKSKKEMWEEMMKEFTDKINRLKEEIREELKEELKN